ncbi:unnamed protein product [Calypogeia fissa]
MALSFVLPQDDDAVKRGPPIGVRVIRRLRGKDASLNTYKYSVLFMTFIAYACYHASRKPFSIVKSVLDDVDYDNNAAGLNGTSHAALYPFLPVNHLVTKQSSVNGSYQGHWYYDRAIGRSFQSVNGSSAPGFRGGALKGWAPFNEEGGKGLLGDVDLAFLASYAIGMYFAGQLGDRLDLRYFLTLGMLGSGFFVCMFGLGYWFNIHSIYYFLGVQMLAGVLQSTGWPSVVSIVGKWFGKGHRGLIMGIWNAHTSVGNITGSLLAAAGLAYGWGWSFLLPGFLQVLGGILMFFFLVVEPADVGLVIHEDVVKEHSASPPRSVDSAQLSEKHDEEAVLVKEDPEQSLAVSTQAVNGTEGAASGGDEETGLLPRQEEEEDSPIHHGAVGFVQAWNIPGVAPFAFCLFFSKLVAYTFLNWLPFYITQTKIDGGYLDDKTAGNLSTLFDVGGVIGGILAGHLSDRLNARAITAAGFMYAAIPALFLYRTYGSVSLTVNIVLMMVAGMLVNGPYALITTAVSADLGTHTSLRGNPRALATVTAIIDGTGSVGAAIGPLLTGYISELSWDYVFIFLMVAALLAGLLLTRLVIGEVIDKIHKANLFQSELAEADGVGGSLNQRLLNGRH